ncbi:MAG: biopolymer transporter ExbD [Proteobacteria bacterium]|nr:biopolymer transporter ExbD [Pseudomonadota bacterium]MBU0965363.1 biopolymer transporter ExbD [Pseudomonadota bacterium]
MEDKTFDTINVIPFIDIMLVLLVIVLTTSTFIARGVIPVDLPRAGAGETETIKSQTIDIDRNGRIFFNAKEVEIAGLVFSLAELPREMPILVRADRTLPLQGFVEVMEAIKNAGFRRVSLQTEERP